MAQFPTSIRFNRPSKKRAALTLIEVLMVLTVMSMVAAFGIVQFKDTTGSVRSTKLQQDVAALNRAVRTYAMSGGDLETATTGDAIIAKLKGTVSGKGS